jgi:hypothetical protein
MFHFKYIIKNHGFLYTGFNHTPEVEMFFQNKAEAPEEYKARGSDQHILYTKLIQCRFGDLFLMLETTVMTPSLTH